MAEKSKIEWTDASWNPIVAYDGDGKRGWHCEKVSPGCAHCYAETLNGRLGTGTAYTKRADLQLALHGPTLEAPLRWRKPRRVFVCSMTDLFLHHHAGDWLDQVFAVMAACPQHQFQVLTKRPERMQDYFAKTSPSVVGDIVKSILDEPVRVEWPIPNVWLGVSVENQEQAEKRVPVLLETPAAVRFLSCEPLLEDLGALNLDGIHWVIIGGESGPQSRPCPLPAVRPLVKQCQAANVACFVKQLGREVTGLDFVPKEFHGVVSWPPPDPWRPKDPKGGDPSEWPEDLRVREYPRSAKAADRGLFD